MAKQSVTNPTDRELAGDYPLFMRRDDGSLDPLTDEERMILNFRRALPEDLKAEYSACFKLQGDDFAAGLKSFDEKYQARRSEIAWPPKPREPVPAIAEDFIEFEWNESPLPVHLREQLKRADRALHGLRTIHELLHADALGKAEERDNENVHFDGLAPIDAEGLRFAMIELVSVAADAVECVRNDRREPKAA